MYDPTKKIMYELLLSADQKTRSEKLTWLNIGPGNEAIDGRAILYAALTSSPENRLDAFNELTGEIVFSSKINSLES